MVLPPLKKKSSLQGRAVRERSPAIHRKVRDLDGLDCIRADRNELEGKRRVRDIFGASKVTEALGERSARNAVAREHGVHAHAVVEIVARNGARDEVDIVVCVHALDFEHLRACEALPGKAKGGEEARVPRPELVDELDRVWRDVDVEDTIHLEADDGGREEVLEYVVARREVP